MDTSKTDEILSWQAPRNVSEMCTFMGLCGYYQRYVQGCASIAGPIHELTQMDTPFVQTEWQQRAFEVLKVALISAPILAMSQDEGMFVLDVDASDLAIRAALQQTQGETLRVIGYASLTFNACE